MSFSVFSYCFFVTVKMYSFNYQICLLSFALVCFCTGVTSSNILVVSPVPNDSHFKISEAMTIGLANAGHKVTIVSAYEYKPQHSSKSIQSIQVTGAVQSFEELKAKDSGAFDTKPIDTMVSMLFYGGVDLCNLTLTNPDVRALFNRTYDLVIVDVFGTESLIGLGQIFDAPVIGFTAYSMARWSNLLPLSCNLNFPASLFHRLHNSISCMHESIVLAYLHHPLQRSVYNNAFPNVELSYDEVRANVAITFVNSHSSLTEPMTNVPNIIEVGGIHIKRRTYEKKSSLPQDIKQFLDTATDGVVYLSFGSIAEGDELSTTKQNAFIDTFAKFKQKFIWKFNDSTVRMPKNVYAKGGLPQTDIIGHRNIKVFISHGGLLDCIEAVHHGIPILGVPLFDNEIVNVKRGAQNGWAVKLDYSNITASSVEWALNEILQEKYLETARKLSQQHRNNQPMTPTDTMVYWSEYVIRHKGAPHLLRAPQLDLNYIQQHNGDILMAILAVIVLCVYAVKWTMHKVFLSRLRVKVE